MKPPSPVFGATDPTPHDEYPCPSDHKRDGVKCRPAILHLNLRPQSCTGRLGPRHTRLSWSPDRAMVDQKYDPVKDVPHPRCGEMCDPQWMDLLLQFRSTSGQM